MSFKYFIPKIKNNVWRDYWVKKNLEKEVDSCRVDELWIIIKKFVKLSNKVIDAGCGLGRWVIFLSRQGYNVVGVDNFKDVIERLKNFDKTLKVIVADVRSLPFKDEEFDVYLSFGVVEHFEEGPTKVLREAKRILKEGGIIILETPYDNLLRRVKRLIKFFLLRKKEKPMDKFQFYEYRFTTTELKKFLKNLNFKILATYSKDLLLDNESIGLWSDFPFLRSKNEEPFKLNRWGVLIKKTLKPFKILFSGCTVVVAKKECRGEKN